MTQIRFLVHPTASVFGCACFVIPEHVTYKSGPIDLQSACMLWLIRYISFSRRRRRVLVPFGGLAIVLMAIMKKGIFAPATRVFPGEGPHQENDNGKLKDVLNVDRFPPSLAPPVLRSLVLCLFGEGALRRINFPAPKVAAECS